MISTSELSTHKLMAELLKDPDRKSILRMVFEVLYLFIRHRKFPRHYFSRYLFKKDRTNIMDYFPDKFLYNIKPLFNDKEAREVLENKLYFNFYYSQFNLRLPKIVMYNHRKLFVVDKESIEVNSLQDFKSLLKEVISKSSGDGSIFIKKTYWSFGGDKIFKIFLSQFDTDPDGIKTLYSEVIKSGFLFQETIKQHPELDKLNASCLNTIRIDTFIDCDGKIEIMSGYLRTSIKNFHVDNISSGGCGIPVDIQTGKLKKHGFLTMKYYGLKLPTFHPVTQTVFEDFSIPFFVQAKELVIRAAGYMPALRLVGWDVAIGETGPVLIEGNSDYDIGGNDLSELGYRANPVFRKVLKEINYL